MTWRIMRPPVQRVMRWTFEYSFPDELALVSELFPGGMEHPDALFPIDLNAFNAVARPKGFLATWEPSGLLLFSLRI
jgi:hypothetical protein